MGTAAGLHDDATDCTVGEPALKLAARQAGAFDDALLIIGHRQLEHVLGKIDSHDRNDGSSIHLGLSLAALR
jgi:hypothetical protein